MSESVDALRGLAAAYGMSLDDWQLGVLSSWLSVGDDGRWEFMRVGLSVPRQNGKNVCLEFREIYGAVFLGESILHTAHRVDTNRDHYETVRRYFDVDFLGDEDNPLAPLLASSRSTNGQEMLTFTSGGSIVFKSRKHEAARGFTFDVIVFDEAQHLTDEQSAAVLSSASAGGRKNPQIIYTGTPPENCSESNIFYRLRAEGLEHPERVCWTEISAHENCDIDDEEEWRRANPAIGAGRMLLDFVRAERSGLSDLDFMRERLGMWVSSARSAAIPPQFWAERGDPTVRSEGSVVIGVDVSPARDSGSVVACEALPDGNLLVDLVQSRSGTVDWLVPYVEALSRRDDVEFVVCDSIGAAANIGEQLKARNVPIVSTRAQDYFKGCATVFDAIVAGGLIHLDQPSLNAAVLSAGRRKVGESFAWSRTKSDTDISPLVAMTLAVWGSGNKRDTMRKVKRRGTGKVAAW